MARSRRCSITSAQRSNKDSRSNLEAIQIAELPDAALLGRGSLGADGPKKLLLEREKTSCAADAIRTNKGLPNTHVPVVVCRSAGIWTRGQSTAPGRPAAGGEPAHPAQRGTRLEATTDRAFLVSAGPPKVGDQRGLSILPGVRTGLFLVQTMAMNAESLRASSAPWLRRSS